MSIRFLFSLIALSISLIAKSQNLVSISPNIANAGQTLSVTIVGQNVDFTQGSGTSVYLSNISSGSSTYINAYSVSATNSTNLSATFSIPNNAANGYYSVEMFNPEFGFLYLSSSFFINGPKITSITPNTANAGQTLNVSIVGQNVDFTQGSGTSVYLYNSSSASPTYISAYSVSANNSTNLSATFSIPSHAENGYWNLGVYDNNLGEMSLENGFYINGPKITSVTPNMANAGQTLNVSIVGQNVDFTQGSGTSVYLFNFNSASPTYISAYSVSANNSTNLSATFSIPSYAKNGYWNLGVYDYNLGSMSLENGFYINGPKITSVTPNSANAGQTLNVSIVGQNLDFTQGSGTSVYLYNTSTGSPTYINAYSVTANSSSTLSATFSIPINAKNGYWNIGVYSANYGEISLIDGFNINGAKIASVTPNSANAGQTLNVSIVGQNVDFTQGSGTTLYLYNSSTGSSTNIIGYSVTANNSTNLSATLSIPINAKNGFWNIGVYNDNYGEITLIDGFNINGAKITTITPNSASAGQALTVSIVGQNVDFTQGSGTSLYLYNSSSGNYINAYSITYNNSNNFSANLSIPSNALNGNWDVVAYNSFYGEMRLQDSFQIINGSSSLNDLSKKTYKIYPNPFNNQFYLKFDKNTENLKYRITDQLGREISSKFYHNLNNEISIDLFEYSLDNGIYFIEIETSSEKFLEKIIKSDK